MICGVLSSTLICVMCFGFVVFVLFFFKQKTAYEMRISDGSSDVCSSDLSLQAITVGAHLGATGACPRIPVAPRCAPTRPMPMMRAAAPPSPAACRAEIGRASCRERVCQYV